MAMKAICTLNTYEEIEFRIQGSRYCQRLNVRLNSDEFYNCCGIMIVSIADISGSRDVTQESSERYNSVFFTFSKKEQDYLLKRIGQCLVKQYRNTVGLLMISDAVGYTTAGGIYNNTKANLMYRLGKLMKWKQGPKGYNKNHQSEVTHFTCVLSRKPLKRKNKKNKPISEELSSDLSV
jgi:hypothetical protein